MKSLKTFAIITLLVFLSFPKASKAEICRLSLIVTANQNQNEIEALRHQLAGKGYLLETKISNNSEWQSSYYKKFKFDFLTTYLTCELRFILRDSKTNHEMLFTGFATVEANISRSQEIVLRQAIFQAFDYDRLPNCNSK